MSTSLFGSEFSVFPHPAMGGGGVVSKIEKISDVLNEQPLTGQKS